MPKKEPTTLGQRLKIARNEAGLTQDYLAEKINTNRSTYSYYELSKTEPPLERLAVFAREMGVPLEFFLEDCDSGLFPAKNEKVTPTKLGDLTEEEQCLLALFRSRTPKQQRQCLRRLDKSTI